MMETIVDFIFGFLGGAFVELLKHHRFLQETPGPAPAIYRSKYYWFVTIAMMVAGGLLTVAYQLAGAKLNPIIDINIGASAPLLIGTFGSKPPKVD